MKSLTNAHSQRRREVTEEAPPSLTFSIVTRHNTQFSMKANILAQDNFVLYKEKSFNKISSIQRLYIFNEKQAHEKS